MDILALICFIVAAVVFIGVGRFRYGWVDIPLGLFLLTIGFIFQFVHITGHVVHVN